MNPGRELDALVAEKVMGWEWTTIDGKKYLLPDTELVQVSEYYDNTGYREVKVFIPHYSTGIASAWEVVEKLRKDFMCFTVTDIGGAGNILCCIGNGEAISETAPHAICLAALKAVAEDAANVPRET